MRHSVLPALIALTALCMPAMAQPTPAPSPSPAPAAKPATAAKPAAAPAKPAQAPAAAPAPAKELWFVAKTASGAIGYNAYSITHDSNLGVATFTNVVFVNTPQQSPRKAAFQYAVGSDRIDCIGDKFQPQGRLLFSADQKIVDEYETSDTKTWLPLTGNPQLNFFKQIVCRGSALGKAKQATNFPAAMKLMKEMAAAK